MPSGKFQGTESKENKYARSTRFQLRRVDSPGHLEQPRPTEYRVARYKLVRDGRLRKIAPFPKVEKVVKQVREAPVSAPSASCGPRPNAPQQQRQQGWQSWSIKQQAKTKLLSPAAPQPHEQQKQQQHHHQTSQTSHKPAPLRSQQRQVGPLKQRGMQPVDLAYQDTTDNTIAMSSGQPGKQPSTLAVSINNSRSFHPKRGTSALRKRPMTWRRTSEPLKQPEAADTTSSPLAPASNPATLRAATTFKPAAAYVSSVKSPVGRRKPGRKWNKYIRSAYRQPTHAAGRQAALMPPRAEVPGKRKWNKYVRLARTASPSTALAAMHAPLATAAMPAPVPQRSLLLSRCIKPSSKKVALSRGKVQRLLRLGSNMYKVSSGKGGSRSLHRQSSSMLSTPVQRPYPPQQQQQQQGQPQGLGGSVGTEAIAKPVSGQAALPNNGRLLVRSGGQAKAQPSSRLRSSSGSKGRGAAPHAGGAGRIVYCPLYCRTGRCERRGKGCPFKHDPVKRAVCPRWLRGGCTAAPCPLQHQRVKDLMPACMHFLKGLCNATDCPYLHVNLSADAPVCKAFLRGYCAAGARCPHKHYTLRMVKEERRMEQAPKARRPLRRQQQQQQQPGGGGGGTGHGHAADTEAGASRKRRGGGRYFDGGAQPPLAKQKLDAGAGAGPPRDGTAAAAIAGEARPTPAPLGGQGGEEGVPGEEIAQQAKQPQVGGGELQQQRQDEGGEEGVRDGPEFLMDDVIPL